MNELRGTVLVRTWRLYEPWIVARRELFHQASLFEQLQRLAGRLVELRAQQGKPPIEII